jgi:hypothetical protein
MEEADLEVKVRYRKKFSKNAIKLFLKHALFEKDFVYRIFDTSGNFFKEQNTHYSKKILYIEFSTLPGIF